MYYAITTDGELMKSPRAVHGKMEDGKDVTLVPIEECGVVECVMLSKSDFRERGYDPKALSVQDMNHIAEAICEAACETLYWDDIDYWAKEYGLPELEHREGEC